jgi:uncharacterized protein
MYLVGAQHPNKTRCGLIVERLAGQGERMVTDAEVYQEILHRYTAIGRTEFIDPAFKVLDQLVDEVIAIERATLDRARTVLSSAQISARDAIHAAAMAMYGINRIVTFDSGFDSVPGILRITA